MTAFEERKQAYEAKFARDQEFRFKAAARRDRNLCLWAAGMLRFPGAEASAKEVIRADFQEPGDEDVIAKAMTDFKAKGVAGLSAASRRAARFDGSGSNGDRGRRISRRREYAQRANGFIPC